MEGLKESAGFIRSQVAKTINLRITPELIFEIDDSLEYGEKIEKNSKRIKKRRKRGERRIKFNSFILYTYDIR